VYELDSDHLFFCGTIELDWSNVAHSSFLHSAKKAPVTMIPAAVGMAVLAAVPEAPGSVSCFGEGLPLR